MNTETLENAEAKEQAVPTEPVDLQVIVNGRTIFMHGKPEYVFVDVFEYIDFDLSSGNGRAIVTQINEKDALFTQKLFSGDKIEIYWKEN